MSRWVDGPQWGRTRPVTPASGMARSPDQKVSQSAFAASVFHRRCLSRSIDRWICPDVFRDQDTSVSKAKKAISDYRKAVGRPEGLAELMVFYCERAAGFCAEVGFEDDTFFAALVRMYEQALKLSVGLTRDERDRFLARLDAVCRVCNSFGYGVSDDMRVLFAEYISDER